MKHLVLFLNYCQSRLDNPVYRLFATESLYRRNATLLFLLKPLDERELQHEVAELRKSNKTQEDITFHVCANFSRPEEGEQVVQTIRLIRRLFPSDVTNHYPTFIYGQIPTLNDIGEEQRKTVWRNLVVINKAVSDFIECRLLSTVYLYNDQTQKPLAEFIFNVTHSEISYDKLSAKLPVKQGELFQDLAEETEDESEISIDFPPIFGGFNTYGIRYPEEEIRVHIHYNYLLAALRYSLPEVNETKLETCNDEVQRILSFVPISTSRLCLQEDGFINLTSSDEKQWLPTDKFWEENIELQMQGLSDVPRADWMIKIRQRVDALYQGRFRDIGTDYFFKLESNKTGEYSSVLFNIIKEEFETTVKSKPYSPETQKNIVRGIVNVLQQKVMEIQKLKADTLTGIDGIEHELYDIKDQWNGLGILSRLRGKDGQVLSLYRDALTRLMIQKTVVPGCDFAVKLLNELIPLVAALIEKCEDFQRIFTEAIRATETMVKETDPQGLFGIFGNDEISQARIAIESDSLNLKKEYMSIIACLFEPVAVVDGDDLLSRVRGTLIENADNYINKRMEDCAIPQILELSIVDRVQKATNAIGGLSGFVDNMKRKTPITIGVKKSCAVTSKFLLIAPELPQQMDGIEHLLSSDYTQMQLLNIRYGLTLQDLDGFAGQRMFVEPSIF